MEDSCTVNTVSKVCGQYAGKDNIILSEKYGSHKDFEAESTRHVNRIL